MNSAYCCGKNFFSTIMKKLGSAIVRLVSMPVMNEIYLNTILLNHLCTRISHNTLTYRLTTYHSTTESSDLHHFLTSTINPPYPSIS